MSKFRHRCVMDKGEKKVELVMQYLYLGIGGIFLLIGTATYVGSCVFSNSSCTGSKFTFPILFVASIFIIGSIWQIIKLRRNLASDENSST